MIDASQDVSLQLRLDPVCDRFESAWKSGDRPQIGQFLADVPEDDRPALRRELLRLDVACRRRRGEAPQLADYTRELPGLEVLLELLAGKGAEPSTGTSGGNATSHAGGASLTRFRILRHHARGGLGQVSVALDTELNREVALKEIQPHRADDTACRARFVLEGEVTGGLEHPGIVPIYSLGAGPEGRPFYAMRFIRGESMRAAIDRFHGQLENTAPVALVAAEAQEVACGSTADHRQGETPVPSLRQTPGRPVAVPPTVARVDFASLAFRQLVQRLVDVCNAVAYAHSRHVIHRDLKPANIMLGGFGEALVVDWGLAKRVGEAGTAVSSAGQGFSAEHTQPGEWLGTPAYMSPEQAEGDLARLGSASDVYSLGATLYHLLAGRPPIQGADLAELRRAIVNGTFDRPRQVNADIPRPLEAICLKAMSLQPDDRYPTASALARDIEQWLADQPVSAWPEPFLVRARRFVRAHQALVSTAVVALLLVAAGSVLATWQQSRHARMLGVKNQELDAQRAKAQAREEMAIEAVKRFRDAVVENPQLKGNPSLDKLRKTLLQEPLAFFQKLRSELQVDHDTRPKSLVRLAIASLELAQLTEEIGDKQDALRTFEESRMVLERLAREHPHVAEFHGDLAASHNHIGNLLRKTGSPDEALQAYQRAKEILERLVREHPTAGEFQRRLAHSNNNLGLLFRETGKLDEALSAHEQAKSIQEGLTRGQPAVSEFQRELAGSHNNIGNLLHQIGKSDEALLAHERAKEIEERLARENPTDVEFQNGLASSLNNIGVLLGHSGKPEAALAAHEQARDIRARLARENPTVTEFQSNLAISFHNIGTLLYETDKSTEALAALTQANQLWERLAREHPSVTRFQSSLAASHSALGRLLEDAGLPDEALAADERARVILEQLARENPSVTEFQRELAYSHNHIGVLHRAAGNPNEALAAYEKARAIRERLAQEHPTVVLFQHDLAGSYNNVGLLLKETGRPAEARATYERAREIRERLARDNPDSPDFARDAGSILNNLSLLDLEAKRFAEARDLLREAITWQKAATAKNPRNPTYRQYLAVHYRNLLDAANGLNDPELAAVAQQGLADLAASDPRLAELDQRLAAVLVGEQVHDQEERLTLAQRAYDTRRFAVATRLFAEALERDPRLADDRQTQYAYNASCAAALAASGQSQQDPPADDTAKAVFRRQALEWLQTELGRWTKVLESATSDKRQDTFETVSRTMAHWQRDPDLAGVRGDAIEALPETEREGWRAIWLRAERLQALSQDTGN